MKKCLLLALLCLFVFALLTPMSALAEFKPQPKPSITILFNGLKNRPCYVTLLSKNSFDPDYGSRPQNDAERSEALNKLVQYYLDHRDEGPYAYTFLWSYDKVDANGYYQWMGNQPVEFKVVAYFTDTDTYAVSDAVYQGTFFPSFYTVDASQLNPTKDGQFSMVKNAVLPAAKNIDYGKMLLLLLALLVELGIAWLFGLRSVRQLLVITAANIVTQLPLCFALSCLIFMNISLPNYLFTYLGLELAVVAVEAVIYALTLNRLRRRAAEPVTTGTCIGYSIAANTASFVAGLVLALVYPAMFL